MHALTVVGLFVAFVAVLATVSWLRGVRFGRPAARRSRAANRLVSADLRGTAWLGRRWYLCISAGAVLILLGVAAGAPLVSPAGSLYIPGAFLVAAGVAGFSRRAQRRQ